MRAVGFPFFNLYRLTVIAAGRRVAESQADGGVPPGRGMRAIAKTFDSLMRVNARGRRLGFQMVAVARAGESGA